MDAVKIGNNNKEKRVRMAVVMIRREKESKHLAIVIRMSTFYVN